MASFGGSPLTADTLCPKGRAEAENRQGAFPVTKCRRATLIFSPTRWRGPKVLGGEGHLHRVTRSLRGLSRLPSRIYRRHERMANLARRSGSREVRRLRSHASSNEQARVDQGALSRGLRFTPLLIRPDAGPARRAAAGRGRLRRKGSQRPAWRRRVTARLITAGEFLTVSMAELRTSARLARAWRMCCGRGAPNLESRTRRADLGMRAAADEIGLRAARTRVALWRRSPARLVEERGVLRAHRAARGRPRADPRLEGAGRSAPRMMRIRPDEAR